MGYPISRDIHPVLKTILIVKVLTAIFSRDPCLTHESLPMVHLLPFWPLSDSVTAASDAQVPLDVDAFSPNVKFRTLECARSRSYIWTFKLFNPFLLRRQAGRTGRDFDEKRLSETFLFCFFLYNTTNRGSAPSVLMRGNLGEAPTLILPFLCTAFVWRNSALGIKDAVDWFRFYLACMVQPPNWKLIRQ